MNASNEHPPTPPPSDRTKVRRLPQRGEYDAQVIHDILDEGLVCHVGMVESGQPFVLPMGYARSGDWLLLHGSMGSRLLRAARDGAPLCVTVTLMDGLVLARSVFHHSFNYRSVMVLGTAEEISDPTEKAAALEALVEHFIPGRGKEARPPNEKEDRATMVLRMSLSEASAKVRTGPPGDEEEDYALDVWAGVIPLRLEAADPEADPLLRPGIPLADSARDYRRP